MRRLLIRPGAIGDVIASLPALHCLRSGCTYTEVWTPRPVVPLLLEFDRVVALADTGLDRLEIPGQPHDALQRLRGFDSIVSWYGATRGEFRAALAGLPVLFFDALPSGRHATDFYLDQAATVQACQVEAVPRLPVLRRAEGFTVIHPFSGSPRKNWPLDQFQEVARRLAGPVHWLAGPEESLPGAVAIPDLWELAHWLAGARLYIGNDSGITHLAAAIGVPTIAIFRITNPDLWAPRGARVLVEPTVDQLLAEADAGQDHTEFPPIVGR